MTADNQIRARGSGRSFALILAAIAAMGWGFAFYAGLGGIDRETIALERIAALEADNATLKERNATLADALATRREAEDLLHEIETQIDQARNRLVHTLEDRRDLEASLSALQNDIAQLGRDEGAAMPVSATATGQVASPAAVNAALVRLDRMIDHRNGKLQAIRAARSAAEARLTAANDALDETRKALSRDERAAVEMRERLRRLGNESEQLESLIAQRKMQAAALAEDIDRAAARLAALQGEHARLRETMSGSSDPVAEQPVGSAQERLPDGTRVIRVNPAAR